MCSIKHWFFSLVAALVCMAEVNAAPYTHAIRDEGWRSRLSVFECRLEHPVPDFGDAVFCTPAGGKSVFFIQGDVARFEPGKAKLFSQSPVWEHTEDQKQLAAVPVKRGTKPLRVGTETTELMLKRKEHQQALVTAATSGNPKFFLGTDSAPHNQDKKETACGCAGCYTAYAAMPLYAQTFEEAGALDKLEGFASHFGPDFYGLPRNTDTMTLTRKPWQAPNDFDMDSQKLIPLLAGETLNWQVVA